MTPEQHIEFLGSMPEPKNEASGPVSGSDPVGTPRTDAAEKRWFGDNREGMSVECVLTDFAKQLERELAQATTYAKAQRELAATHRCKVCGALWIRFKDSWSLASQECGSCCDNHPMDAQIEAVGMTKELDERWNRLYERSDAQTNKWYLRAMELKGASETLVNFARLNGHMNNHPGSMDCKICKAVRAVEQNTQPVPQ